MAMLLSILPATIFAVLGYLILYCAVRSKGGMRAFGRGLAIWLFILSGLSLSAGAYVSIAGFPPMEEHFQDMHGRS